MKALIVGGGIGGLATALSLHDKGIEAEVLERSREIRELGVGINTLPHAIKELAALGLLERLDEVGIRTYELIYTNRFGQEIWREPRGLDAGYEYPQFSIHRGKLQGVLHEAVRERLGDARIHTGHDFVDLEQDAEGVTARFRLREGGGEGSEAIWRGDLLIGADGIHSRVRAIFYPDEGPPRWNGIMLWRGATEWPPFLTGRSMVIAGGMDAKLVLYPISNEVSTPGTTLMNWAVMARIADGSSLPPRREDWSRPGRIEELMPLVESSFRIDILDPRALIRATPEFYEYPVCDRDPVPRWSFGRVTLLGDAAHPMYPVGSNGASQAILDARLLAQLLAASETVEEALTADEAERLPKTAEIVRTNRLGGPERVIDVVTARAPNGFARIEDVASREELKAIVAGYSQLAGFAKEQVNRPS
jgi:2-polyprenyl-6-methoxyphenol hydroxylase-like FAD-dependent oxidoreductase